MALYDTIRQDMTNALKQKDEFRLGVLRMLVAALQNQEIEKHAKLVKSGKEPEPLNDEEVMAVIDRETKKRKEVAMGYEQAGRPDASSQEFAEAKILQMYLPERMYGDELRFAVKALYESVPETDRLQFGKVMQKISENLRGKADMSEVSVVLRELMQAR